MPSCEPSGRRLDTTESLFAAFNAAGAFLTVQAIEIEGPLTENLLVRAFAHLEHRHPRLRARIVPHGDTHYWCTGDDSVPRISVIHRAPERGLEAATESVLPQTYDAARERLWRCTWIPLTDDRHWLLFSLHHSVADGISGMILVRDLLATLSALCGVGSLPPVLAPGPSLDDVLQPVPCRTRLRHHARRLRARLVDRGPIPPIERTAPPEQRRTRVVFGSISGKTMLALRAISRTRNATVSGVLAAAMLESVRATFGPLRAVPVAHPISMRGNVIPVEQVGCFTTNLVTTHPLRRRWSLWDEARDTTKQLRIALARGDAVAALLATRGKTAQSAAAMGAAIHDPRMAGRTGAINLANRGTMADFSAGPFRVSAWYPATSNHTFGNSFQLSCATVGETFYFGAMYVEPLMSDLSARLVVDGFVARLSRAADEKR